MNGIPSTLNKTQKTHTIGTLGLVMRILGVLGIALVAFLIARLSLKWCLLGLGSVLVVFALILRPTIGIYLLAFSIPFGSLYPLVLGSFTLDANDFLVALIAFSWFLSAAAFRRDQLVGGRWLLALGFFIFTLLCGLLPATNLTEALKELFKWLEFGLISLYVVSKVRFFEIEGIAVALLLAGILQGLYGISQFLAGGGPEAFAFLGRYTRAYGTFEQPNPFGGYMGLLLPIAYSIVLTGWKNAFSGKRLDLKRITWWLALAALLVMLTALIMSGSRGALLGFTAGIVVVAVIALRKVWPLLAVLAVALLAAGPYLITLIPQAYISRVTDIFALPLGANLETIEITDANFSLIERAAHWQAAWRMFSLHPWFGVGLGQYTTIYLLVALPRWSNPLGHAHNYLLNILAEGGIFGLVGYLALQFTLLGQALRSALNTQMRFRWLGLAAVGAWTALFAHNLVDNLYVHYLQLVVGILFGLVILVVNQPKDLEVTG